MKLLKSVLCVLLCAVLCLALTSCGSDRGVRSSRPKYNEPTDSDTGSGTIAENGNYTFSWNENGKGFNLLKKSSNAVWNMIANVSSLEQSATTQQILDSEIVIEYGENLSLATESAYSSDTASCIKQIEDTENGIKVTYFFTNQKISIPVEYTLRESGVSATVNCNDIAESGDKMLIKVTLCPFAASIPNNSQDGYLFIPSGTGGLSYTSNKITRSNTIPVYGEDAVMNAYRHYTQELCYLPVFGAKNGDNAIFGIIENGAENATLITTVNDEKYNFSVIYPTFNVRNVEVVEESGISAEGSKTNIYDDDIVDTVFSLGYYLLNGENANYNGMAKTYREYLIEKYDIKEKTTPTSPVSIKYLGGVYQKKFLFGVPYYSTYALTTVKEAEIINNEISKATGTTPIVQLTGFGQYGLENIKIAGGFKIDKNLGTFKEINSWSEKYSESNGIISLDFDVLHLSESSNGFSVNSDVARAASGEVREKSYYHVALLDGNQSLNSYYMISRDKLSDVCEKLRDLISDKKLKTVSLSTLCNTAYSDYSDREYFAKSNMSKQVLSEIETIKKQNVGFVSNAPFEYAASISDYIMDAPIGASKIAVVDEEIPFYQIVFSGIKNIYNTSVNLADDDNTAILKAIESGVGLSYTVSENYASDLIESSQTSLYATKYSGLKTRIINQVNEHKAFYDKISNSSITKHEILENGLRRIVYDNGVTVYVNYTTEKLSDGNNTIEPNGYLIAG